MNTPAAEPRETRPSLVRRTLGAVAGNSTIRKVAISTPFVRDLAWRFVAGEDLVAGLAAVRALNQRGLTATLNVVGTHVRREADAIAATDEVIATLRGIRAADVASHVSLKLTQVGLDVDPDLCRRQLRRILDSASHEDVFVRIDMEESRYVQATIDLFEEMRDAYGTDRVGIVLQSYLRARRGDLARLVATGSRIRVVRGGYWESPDVVYQSKAEIDTAFYADVETLVREGDQPAIATHDAVAIETACRAAADAGRGPSEFEFQMLLGVRPDLQARLVRDGYAVRCYVPYGGQWYAYVLGCIRRLPSGLLAEAREHTASGARGRARTIYSRVLLAAKRAVDIVGAAIGIVVLSPVLAWTALAVVASMGPPIMFSQRRPGRGGRPFTIRKFRTMRAARPGEVWFESDADRVTRLGRFLRRTSIDELPELRNVLRGEMSLVGPRPLLMEYLPHYTDRERRRHDMRPGITGWAAVSGRHTLPFEDRLELDAWYVDNWSLALDVRILLRTVTQVLNRSGVHDTQDFAEIAFPARFQAGLAGDTTTDGDPTATPASVGGGTKDQL